MHLDRPFDLCEEPGRGHKPVLAKRLRQLVQAASGLGLAPLAARLAALVLLFAAAAGAQAQTTLVSNAGEGRDNSINVGNSAFGRIAQRFTTGSNATGYGLSSVGIYIHADNSATGETITVSVHRFDGKETNNLGELVVTLSTPSTLNEGAVNDFTAPPNAVLLPDTRYLVSILPKATTRMISN